MQSIRKGIWICVVLFSAAKSLQSCSTLSDPIDCSLPGSSVHVILQARTLGWVDIAFSNLSLIFQNIFNMGSELRGVLCHTSDSIFCLTPGEPNHIPLLQSGVARNASDGWGLYSLPESGCIIYSSVVCWDSTVSEAHCWADICQGKIQVTHRGRALII